MTWAPSDVDFSAHHNFIIHRDLAGRFASIVGEKFALTDQGSIQNHLRQERGLFEGECELVLRPKSVEEVSQICSLANAHHIGVVPQGGNTGLVGGQIPMRNEIVISLSRMNAIREVDVRSDAIVCEAGVILADARQAADRAGRSLPLSLGSEGSATIGGNLATNAGGNSALSHGVARNLTFGLEVVLADGRILKGLSKLRKDNTGYDLRDLFIGSEGTLGIITAAVLRLSPKATYHETAFLGLGSTFAAGRLLENIRSRTGADLTSFELISEASLELCLKHRPTIRRPLTGRYSWYVLVEISPHRKDPENDLEAILAAAFEDDLVSDAAIATTLEHRNAFWALRETLPEAEKLEGGAIKHDISVPVAKVPEFLAAADLAVAEITPGARPSAFGHFGDGNIHYNICAPSPEGGKGFLGRRDKIQATIYRIALDLGGSISAEHGIGLLKRELFSQVKDPVSLDVMRGLKQALDPKGILNPGKLLRLPPT